MADQRIDVAQVATAADSHDPRPKPSRIPALLREDDLLARTLWTVPETASFMRVSKRTVWRELSDPKSKFPRARRIRGRTLLARDEVLAFLQEDTAR